MPSGELGERSQYSQESWTPTSNENCVPQVPLTYLALYLYLRSGIQVALRRYASWQTRQEFLGITEIFYRSLQFMDFCRFYQHLSEAFSAGRGWNKHSRLFLVYNDPFIVEKLPCVCVFLYYYRATKKKSTYSSIVVRWVLDKPQLSWLQNAFRSERFPCLTTVFLCRLRCFLCKQYQTWCSSSSNNSSVLFFPLPLRN